MICWTKSILIKYWSDNDDLFNVVTALMRNNCDMKQKSLETKKSAIDDG